MGTRSYPQAKRLLITADFRRQQRRTREAVEVGVAENWPTRSGWRFQSVTSRPARASGTKSNIGCSRSSARTGEGKPLISHEVMHQPDCRQLPPPPGPGGEKQARHQHLSCRVEGFRTDRWPNSSSGETSFMATGTTSLLPQKLIYLLSDSA